MKYPLLAAALLVVLVCGCTGQPAQTNTASTSACTSPYDGTWVGVIADSGILSVARAPDYTNTDNPFTASYDFEMTIKCREIVRDYQNGGAETARFFDITHVKASHPLFNCANGCTPGDYSYVQISNNGTGVFGLTYPNGAEIVMVGKPTLGYIQASPDAKTMDLHIYGGDYTGSIGSLLDNPNFRVMYVETYNCQQYGGKGICLIKTILKNTITLTKVS
jgi:hypothetical protein